MYKSPQIDIGLAKADENAYLSHYLIDDGKYCIQLTDRYVPEQVGASLYMRSADGAANACIGDVVLNVRGQWTVRLYPDFGTMNIDMAAYIRHGRNRNAYFTDMVPALSELWNMRQCFRNFPSD